MQQLLILSAMRPERITQFMVSFTASVLSHGQKQEKVVCPPVDLTKMAKAIRPDQIPMILYREEPHLAVMKLQNCASKARVRRYSSSYMQVDILTPYAMYLLHAINIFTLCM